MKLKSVIGSAAVIAAAAVILLGVRLGTAKLAEENAQAELQTMLETVLPGSSTFVPEAYDGEDDMIQTVYQGENGYVLETVAYGYAGNITMLVGVSSDGKVTGLVVRDLLETYGLGAEALTNTKFLSQYLGTCADAEIGTNVDALTGATVSSKAITKAVNAAVGYVTGADTTSSATAWGG